MRRYKVLAKHPLFSDAHLLLRVQSVSDEIVFDRIDASDSTDDDRNPAVMDERRNAFRNGQQHVPQIRSKRYRRTGYEIARKQKLAGAAGAFESPPKASIEKESRPNVP